MSKHGATERYIIELFKNVKEFNFENEHYKIIVIGKPRPNKGECKTDIYILAQSLNTNSKREIKISIKQDDADFLENKISLERATEIFGDDTKGILIKSIKSVEKSFLEDYLVYFKKYRRTEEKCIKIGWKFELLNKHGGERSGEILLNDSQKIDVYSGSNLNPVKRNAKVNGEVIKDSGIANYILEIGNTEQDLDYYIKNIVPIEEFAIKQKIYFACKAINYRSQHNKWDGDRPLSVYIDWKIDNGKLIAEFVMDKPLEKRANEIGEKICGILKELEIDSNNFDNLNEYLHENIIIAKH
ncbi:hypothetical protein [Flavobacterium sp.]